MSKTNQCGQQANLTFGPKFGSGRERAVGIISIKACPKLILIFTIFKLIASFHVTIYECQKSLAFYAVQDIVDDG